MKLSGPLAIIAIVVALVVIVAVGFYVTQQATGGAVADQIHAEMSKMPSGQGPSYGGKKPTSPGNVPAPVSP